MKRVLIVTFDFPPQGGTGAIRVTKFAKYLPEFGWQPVVVASDTLWNPDESLAQEVTHVPVYRVGWPRWVKATRSNPTQSSAYSTKTSGPIRVPSLKKRLVQIVRRVFVPDVNVLWVRNAFHACLKVLREFPCDAVMTTSPPNSVHLVGYKLHTRLGIPWVADFRDAWTAANPALRRLGRIHFARQRQVECQILEACDRAIMVTEPLMQKTRQVFGQQVASKCITITNGFDPHDFTLFSLALPPQDRFVITYVGTVLGPRTKNAFPEGLRLALMQNEIFREKALVRFVGQLDPLYRARFDGLEDNIEIVNMVAHKRAIEMMQATQLLLLLLPNDEEGRLSFTNKFFEYLAARRPILAIVPPGVVSEIVMQYKIGSVAPPDDIPAIAQTLLTLFEQVSAQPEEYSPSETLLACFDRRRLTQSLAEVLNQVTKGNSNE